MPHVNRVIGRIPEWKGTFLFYEGGRPVVRRAAELQSDLRKAVTLLRREGLQRGDRIGIVGANSYAWILLDLACLACGFVSVGFDPIHHRWKELQSELGLRRTYEIPDGATPWQVLGAPPEDADDAGLLQGHAFGPDDIIGMKFTSGSTGETKAIELKRKSVDDTLTNVQGMFHHGPGDKFLLFLPLYLNQQRFWIYSSLLFDHDAVVVQYRLAVMALRRERPTVVMGVPEFFTSLIKGFDPAVPEQKERFRELMGGNIRYLWTGSAPISLSTLKAYEAMGMPLFQGYGMNETCIISKNHPGQDRLGSVGKVVPSKSVRFDDEGQILVKSTHEVNVRYANVPADVSALTFRPDGYVATGDLGHLDADGYLYVTGRVKDIVVLSSGRKVSPIPLENRLEEAACIDKAVVFGSGQSHLAAVISAVPGTAHGDVEAVVAGVNARLPEDERIRKFLLAPEPLTRENGLLTSQFKVRRNAVWARYERELLALYGA
ncbi:AMP-binding protein [Corallococcus carmarthensis]|uniref:AMP-dependent synthetase n=1 Tax=Corallococcus carmarthensis TaxID=2316728 RepID=A0A3A8KJ46_9BACT|nr:AMP-binding protein [Corallococcus carmarthensis]RKH07377.1 AMP-dependent synthetase [Corallococcus carmarthensis]